MNWKNPRVTFPIACEHTICLAIKLRPNHYISHNFDCLICQKGSHNVIYTLNAVAASASAAAVVCVLFLFEKKFFFLVIKILNHQMHLWRSARGREQVTLNACEMRGLRKNGKGCVGSRWNERKRDRAHVWRYKIRNKTEKNDTKMSIKIGQNSSEKWCWSRCSYTFSNGIGEVRDEYSLLPRENEPNWNARERIKSERTNEQNKNVKPQKHRTVHKAIFISNNELQCKHVTRFPQFDRNTIHRVELLLLLLCCCCSAVVRFSCCA